MRIKKQNGKKMNKLLQRCEMVHIPSGYIYIWWELMGKTMCKNDHRYVCLCYPPIVKSTRCSLHTSIAGVCMLRVWKDKVTQSRYSWNDERDADEMEENEKILVAIFCSLGPALEWNSNRFPHHLFTWPHITLRHTHTSTEVWHTCRSMEYWAMDGYGAVSTS